MKRIFGQVVDICTALLILLVGLGIAWGCYYYYWSMEVRSEFPPEAWRLALAMILIAVVVLITLYTRYRFVRYAISSNPAVRQSRLWF